MQENKIQSFINDVKLIFRLRVLGMHLDAYNGWDGLGSKYGFRV